MANMTPVESEVAENLPASPGAKLRIYWGHVACAAVGFGLSWYSLIVHNRIKAGVEDACGISQSCDTVIGHKVWGQIAGIPLGVYGMLFWVMVFVTAVSTKGQPKALALQRLAVATVGLLFSLGLEYVMWGIIKQACPICISVHITSLINFLVAVYLWRKVQSPVVG